MAPDSFSSIQNVTHSPDSHTPATLAFFQLVECGQALSHREAFHCWKVPSPFPPECLLPTSQIFPLMPLLKDHPCDSLDEFTYVAKHCVFLGQHSSWRVASTRVAYLLLYLCLLLPLPNPTSAWPLLSAFCSMSWLCPHWYSTKSQIFTWLSVEYSTLRTTRLRTLTMHRLALDVLSSICWNTQHIFFL